VHWLAFVFLACLAYLAFSRFGVQVVEVVGKSMEPTLEESHHYFLKRWVYYFRPPRRDEVVVLVDPADRGYSVKRIIAVEGDTVQLKGGRVFVNGHRLHEPYLPPHATTQAPVPTGEQFVRLGRGEYFVLGDNRAWSADSREYGPVPRQNILGLIFP
jgi:signal peptidase I